MKEMKQDRLAFDLQSARTIDPHSGHLHVTQTNISKATVNPYLGSEIPRAQELGLDPNRTYQLLRHPEELQKAAQTYDGKPLVLMHKAQAVDDKDHQNRVGSISNPVYEHPYLKANLSVWSQDAIDAIESAAQRELSCGYAYTADMTPGVYEGQSYDGIMRGLHGNHVALVREGRAGKDCHVFDSIEGLSLMTKKVSLSRTGLLAQGALASYLRPKLATDQKIDWSPALDGLTSSNFKDKKSALIANVERQVKGKLAQDADLEDLKDMLEQVEEMLPDDEEVVAKDADPDDETEEEKKKRLAAAAASDESDKDDEDEDDKEKKAKDKKAMDEKLKAMAAKVAGFDAAIAVATAETERRVMQTAREIREAERAVEPRVGQISIACDSADDVYRAALTAMKVDVTELKAPGSAKAVFNAIPAVTPKASTVPAYIAQDSAARTEYEKNFPNATRLKQ